MRIRYEDGPDAVEIPAVGEIVERGKAVDVPKEIGEQLIEQGWVRVGGSGKTSNKED